MTQQNRTDRSIKWVPPLALEGDWVLFETYPRNDRNGDSHTQLVQGEVADVRTSYYRRNGNGQIFASHGYRIKVPDWQRGRYISEDRIKKVITKGRTR